MEDLERHLHFLGLGREESRIYLSCLEYETLPVSTIAKLSGVGRVNCYHHIEKLVQKGLLRSSKQKGNKVFSAEHPRLLINAEKERLNVAESILPDLLSLSSKNPKKPRLEFFEGRSGIEHFFRILEGLENTEIVSFSNFERLRSFFPDPDFLQQHFLKRLKRRVKTRFISPKSKTAEAFREDFFPKDFDQKLLEIFLISSEEFSFASEITIFPEAIGIMNLSSENPIAVLIENKDLFHTQKAVFDLAWLGATSFITQ